MHPDEIDLSERQLWELMWYYNQEPFGDVRSDMRSFSVVASLVSKKVKPTFPYWEQPLTEEEIENTFAEYHDILDKLDGQRPNGKPES